MNGSIAPNGQGLLSVLEFMQTSPEQMLIKKLKYKIYYEAK
jgi:hypothetical protein